MALTPKGITKVESGQNLKYFTVNEAIAWLEQMAGGVIKDRDLSTPPGSPSDGDLYIVKATGSGAWAGHDGELALYLNGWKFIDLDDADITGDGLSFWLEDEDFQIGYRDDAWCWLWGKWPLDADGIWTGRYDFSGTPKKIMTKVLTKSGALTNNADVNITHSVTSINLSGHLAAFMTIRNHNTTPTESCPIQGGGVAFTHNKLFGIRFDATNLILRPSFDATAYYVNYQKVRIEYTV